MPLDYEQTAAALVKGAEDAVTRHIAPLLKRIEELEARQLEKGERGGRGETGLGIAEALIDRDGALVLTFTDGSVKNLGTIPDQRENINVEPLLERILRLEEREPEKGEKGDDGKPGERGSDGLSIKSLMIDRDGHLQVVMADGDARDVGLVVGKDGKDGVKGDKGDPGEKGEKGDDGKDGRDGTDGKDGKDGKDGIAKDGRDGIDGKDGRDGIDGKDGNDGINGKDGNDGINGKDAYAGEAKGLYDPAVEYRAMDVVGKDGCEWRAKKDNPGDLPGPDWMLSAQRGKRGEQGLRGERGFAGEDGKDGASPVQVTYNLDEGKQLIALDNGEILEADIEPLIRAIKGEEQ